jgi:hypothetical protein
MRIQSLLLVGLIALVGCGDKTTPKARSQAQPSLPKPKIVRHKVEEHPMLNAIMKQEMLPGVLEVEVVNSGGAGKVRIHVNQGQKSWEERVHLAAGEQRTIRVSLPNADPGLILFRAEADSPASLLPLIESQPRGESFWGQLLRCMLIGGIIGAVISLLCALFKRHGRQLSTPAGSLVDSRAEERRRAVCSICGTQLRGNEIIVGLCCSCQRRAASV